MTARPDAVARIPELDGIRGVAIGMVLLHHYFYLAIQTRPATALSYALVSGRLLWSGVDLFFVLSGFLIGGILLDARSSANYFRVFYTRRFYRIVPVYAACLLLVSLLAGLVRLGKAPAFSWVLTGELPWFPYVVFLQNFWMSYRNTLGLFSLGVTWSLAVEEQFYLTLPALVRFLSPRRLVTAVCAGIVAAPLLRTFLYERWGDHQYSWVVLMPCRADALLMGVLAAFVMRDADLRARIANNRRAMDAMLLALAAGLVYFILRASSPYSRGMATVGFSWLAAFYVCILVYALLFQESWIASCLRWGWLCWLGSIAYGVYLFHEFIRVLLFGLIWSRAPVITSLREFLVSVLALAVTLLACRLSWLYFERPLVAMGHRLHYKLRKEATARAEALPLNAGVEPGRGEYPV
jgi:peptidoglycan/LPS O-acetylase OafA/YrhL